MEFTFRQRHQACVFPIGDVDLVVLEHGLDCVTQQGGVVARQRCNDQNCRLLFDGAECGCVVCEALEAAQLTKWLVNFNAFMNGDIYITHMHCANAKFGLDIVFAQAVHEFVAGRYTLCQGRVAHGILGVCQHFGCYLGQFRKGLHDGALGFVDLVKHGLKPLKLLHCSNITVVLSRKWSGAPNLYQWVTPICHITLAIAWQT